MNAKDFYASVFNPEAEVDCNPQGFCDLTEQALSSSHVVVSDKTVRAYHYDENFEHKKLINPDRTKGYRTRHDFILVNDSEDGVEIFLLEMKASKDDFSHMRKQLQGGVALMSFLQRLGVDRSDDNLSFENVKFFAAALLHTRQLPDVTDMDKLQTEVKKRQDERSRYDKIPGLLCVVDNRVTLNELRLHCKQVSLDWNSKNGFSEFP